MKNGIMKSIISKTELIKSASIFLLSMPPLDELPEDISEVANKFRSGTINRCAALNYMTEVKSEFVESWIAENERIHKELGSWNAI